MPYTEAVDFNSDQEKCLIWKLIFKYPFTTLLFHSPKLMSVGHSIGFSLQRLGKRDVLEKSTIVILSSENKNDIKKWLI